MSKDDYIKIEERLNKYRFDVLPNYSEINAIHQLALIQATLLLNMARQIETLVTIMSDLKESGNGQR